MTTHIKAIAIGIGIMFGSSATAAELTGQEVLDTHSGKCLTYSGPTSGTQCYNADGTTTYDDASYGTGAGTWSMQGNDLCEKYPGEPIDCGPISRVADGQFSDGTYTWVINN